LPHAYRFAPPTHITAATVAPNIDQLTVSCSSKAASVPSTSSNDGAQSRERFPAFAVTQTPRLCGHTREGKRVFSRLSSAKLADVLVTLAGYVEFQKARIRGLLIQSCLHPESME